MRFILIFICSISLFGNALEFSEIIKSNKKNYSVKYDYNPFEVKIKKEILSLNKKKEYKLEGVFNDSVRINGKWYKNKINGYKIEIKGDKVFLKKGDNVKIIKMKSKF